MKTSILLSLFLVLFGFACNESPTKSATPTTTVTTRTKQDNDEAFTATSSDYESQIIHSYSWLKNYKKERSVVARFPAPKGYKRVQHPSNSFADWLRYLPVRAKNTPVYYHDGRQKTNNVHEAVINIDTGKRDLQQCADAVMRLKAEYHFAIQEYNNIHFNFTSGHRVSFDDWRQGKKPIIQGNTVRFSTQNGADDNSYINFKKYLQQIFMYAGTASLAKEMKTAEIENIQAGDVFIQGGFPGHAVIVIDVAENSAGKKMFMLAQSYMPAQDIHILKNPQNPNHSPWYSLDFGSTLVTPEWIFNRSDLKRFQ